MKSTKYILFLVYVINFFRAVLAFKVSSVSQFEDHDLVNFYKPTAQNLYNVYITNDPNFLFLSGLVTPLFPIFLKIFGYGLLAQFVYIIVFTLILILVYKITIKLSSKKIAAIAILLVSVEPSFFISSLSLAPELLFSFILTLALYFGVCKPIKNIELNYLVLAILLGISVLIRPIALIMVICLVVFWIITYYQTSQTIFLYISMIVPVFAFIWSSRNLIVHGFFNISWISSNNILWYEGVPALSEAKDISFEEAAKTESALRNLKIGGNSSVLESYNYNSQRGLELIFEYPTGWVQSHLKGVGKILFGVYKSKHRIIDQEVFRVNDQVIQSIHFIILGFITLIIWMLFLNGVSQFHKLDILNSRLSFLILIAVLLPATGQVAYARFRSPVIPIICIVAAIGTQNLLNKIYKVTKWKK
jgi:4-amino-4-deoxy-L-arabinose transferase-like glycosyltransferase